MLLRPRYGKCIWCIRPLTSGAGADDSATDEHIFPASLFGTVKMRDCCKTCNSKLGHLVDGRLLSDERIILVAREAGVKETELLARFSGVGWDSHNRPTRCTVKDGQWRFEPHIHDHGFRVGMIDDKVFPQDLRNAKSKLRTLITSDKAAPLTPDEIDKETDELFGLFLKKSGKETVYSPKLRQGLMGVVGPRFIKLDGKYRPYETEWAVAKIAYETGVMLLPPELFAQVWSALDQLRTFVVLRESGKSLFSYESSATAQRCHSVTLSMIADSFHVSVTLFGKATWKLSFTVLENGNPAQLDAFELILRSYFPRDSTRGAKVFVNGREDAVRN